MRYLPISLTLVGFTVAAGLAGCGSDAVTPPPTGGAAGSGANSGASPSVAGNPGTPAAGTGSSGAPVVGTAGAAPGGSGSSMGGSGNVAGSNPTGGTNSSGGTIGVSGSGPVAGGGNPTAGAPSDVDKNGKKNAKPGDMTAVAKDYLKMGDIRLINNNWGALALNCSAPYSVFINADKSFGWKFNRGTCGGSSQKPDFPELEFGIHPFGVGSDKATSPGFSSTTLLPLQVKAITSASVTIDSLAINLQSEGSWDITFEFWLSQKDPNTPSDAGVWSELMTFWGWQANRWPDTATMKGTDGNVGAPDSLKAGDKTYGLKVQSDNWGGWHYFQFRSSDGPSKTFSGKVDIKALIDYLVTKRGYSSDYWVTRFEVGSEIDDNTQGTVTMKNITFEVNGQTRSPVFSQ